MSDAKKEIRSSTLIWLLSFLVMISLLGAVKPVFLNEGSTAVKYLAKSKQLELVHEDQVQSYMASSLYEDQSESVNIGEIASAEELEKEVSFYYSLDKYIAVALLLFSILLLFPKFRNSEFKHVLLLVGFWFIAQSIALMLTGGKGFSNLAVFAHAARWGLPLMLWLFLVDKKKSQFGVPAYL